MPKYTFDRVNHTHYLDKRYLYGTTTILSILGKGGLQWWASGMALKEMGWINPNKHTPEEYYSMAEKGLDKIKENFLNPDIYSVRGAHWGRFLNKCYRAHDTKKKDRAEEGINIHSLCEEYIRAEMKEEKDAVAKAPALIEPFIGWCQKNVKRFLFSELHCYSEKLFVGGICDFAFIDKADNYVLADIKSRDKVYFSDFVQMGAYHTQIEENGGYTPEGEKIFTLDKPFKYHAVFPIGDNFKEPVINERTVWAQKAFENALNLYKAREEWEKSNE